MPWELLIIPLIALVVWILSTIFKGEDPNEVRLRMRRAQTPAAPSRPLPPPESYESLPGEELVLGEAGTVVVMNAHMWHGATANRTAKPRRAMHVYYTRRDKPQQQYQKRLLRPETEARLSASARKLLALDDPLNDELSAAVSGTSGFLK